MKGGLEVYIREDGVLVKSSAPGAEEEFVAQPVSDLGSRLARHASPRSPANTPVTFYIDEDLLFFKKISLPLQTKDLKEAVSYQISMLAPFEGDVLHSFNTVRDKKGYTVTLYVVLQEIITPLLEDAATEGFHLTGLFPESQRYVNQLGKKEKWALLLPGRFSKLLCFSGTSVEDRLLCHSVPSFAEMRSHSEVERIFSPDPQEGFDDAATLLAEKPVLKDFNMLPASYRRPDYIRYLLIALCVLNLCALLTVVGIKEYKISSLLKNLESEVSAILPKVKEVEQLRIEEKQLAASIERIEGIGQNFDIIRFLAKVQNELPTNSYLDQVRMDNKTGSIHLQGYTEDLGELTEQLDSLDQAKLKSTRRRKNKTYFHVEISNP